MKIIFQNIDNSIGIIIPVIQNLEHQELVELGVKDTPSGLPFWIAEDSEIPSDRTTRNSWELDGSQGNPDGHGA